MALGAHFQKYPALLLQGRGLKLTLSGLAMEWSVVIAERVMTKTVHGFGPTISRLSTWYPSLFWPCGMLFRFRRRASNSRSEEALRWRMTGIVED